MKLVQAPEPVLANISYVLEAVINKTAHEVVIA